MQCGTSPRTGKPKRTFVRHFPDDSSDRLLGFRFEEMKPQIQFSSTSPDAGGPDWFKRPSIFQPKWATDTWLQNTGTRIEYLEEMIDSDAIREGVYDLGATDENGCRFAYRGRLGPSPRDLFMEAFHRINRGRGTDQSPNPPVWVIDFELMEERRAAVA
jgi:hypothetical protein